MIKNKASVEASIVVAYRNEEITTFASYYLHASVPCKRRRPPRNDEGCADDMPSQWSVFFHPGRSHGRPQKTYLLGDDLHIAHTYILMNMTTPETDSLYK